MTTLYALVENQDAPVTVHVRDRSDKTRTLYFKNLRLFEAWYRPSAHYFIGTTNGPKFTDIGIDVKSLGSLKVPPEAAKPPKGRR